MFTALTSCSTRLPEKPDTAKLTSKSPPTHDSVTDSLALDSHQVSKGVLSALYVKAIQDFMKTIQQKDRTTFDTLYFANRKMGGPDDFPDIELPKNIAGVEISLLSFGEAHTNKLNHYTPKTPLINLMGWVDKQTGEFIFVTFFPEFKHSYDCYINYKVDPEKKDYVLEKVSIEVLVYDKAGKATHYAIYQNGKHTGDRALDENKK